MRPSTNKAPEGDRPFISGFRAMVTKSPLPLSQKTASQRRNFCLRDALLSPGRPDSVILWFSAHVLWWPVPELIHTPATSFLCVQFTACRFNLHNNNRCHCAQSKIELKKCKLHIQDHTTSNWLKCMSICFIVYLFFHYYHLYFHYLYYSKLLAYTFI